MAKKYDQDALIKQHIVMVFKNTSYGKHLFKVSDGHYLLKHDKNEDWKHVLEFGADFKEYWTKNTPLKIEIEKGVKFPDYYKPKFFAELMKPFHYKKYNFPFDLEVEKFKRILDIFNFLRVDVPVSMFFPQNSNCSLNSNYYHLEYITAILSLDVKDDFSSEGEFWKRVYADMEAIETYYRNVAHPLMKEGVINYLTNRKNLVNKFKDDGCENNFLGCIKNILHSDYWAEVASYLPSYSKRVEKKTKNDRGFSIGINPVYYIDVNKSNLLNLSLGTITDGDIYKMMKAIRDALNATKSTNIEKIELSDRKYPEDTAGTWNNPKIYLSGKELNPEMVGKFIDLLDKMIVEYNSHNIDKNPSTHYVDNYRERDENNEKYLKAVAAAHWLDFELDNSKGKNSKVSKI